jgi:hypothetical protein
MQGLEKLHSIPWEGLMVAGFLGIRFVSGHGFEQLRAGLQGLKPNRVGAFWHVWKPCPAMNQKHVRLGISEINLGKAGACPGSAFVRTQLGHPA